MKKLIMALAIVCAAAISQAASVGWSAAGMNNYANDSYYFFVIGQNGVESMATITALLDAGTSVADKAFGSGVIAANGSANVLAASSGKSLDAGSYTGFLVLFDSASPAAGDSKYVVISGQTGLTKTVSATAGTVAFAAGNVSSIVNDASNWKSFGGGGGDVPDPTSGLLLLIGGAMLALRRKQK